jgi:hypothetical protein
VKSSKERRKKTLLFEQDMVEELLRLLIFLEKGIVEISTSGTNPSVLGQRCKRKFQMYQFVVFRDSQCSDPVFFSKSINKGLDSIRTKGETSKVICIPFLNGNPREFIWDSIENKWEEVIGKDTIETW